MAAKKSSATKTGTKKKAATKRSAPTKRGASAETAAKSGTPKGTKGTKAAAPKAAGAAKKAAPIKLNDRQSELLRKVQGAGATGYTIGQKTEQRTIDALQERKLLKRGAKNKETGQHSYSLTKLGEKHVGAGGSTGGGSTGGNA
jgi:hypothetical protein